MFALEVAVASAPISGAYRLSDDELLRTEFRYHDPENSILGLNTGVPDRMANPVIIGSYDETPPGGRKARPRKPFVRCCHCGKRRHWIGHVVRDDHGEIYIIGSSSCGREHYGVRYEAAERAFRDNEQRKAALLRWKNMFRLVPGYKEEVEFLLRSPALGERERKREELRRASFAGFERISRFAQSKEELVEVRRDRDYQAEQERVDRFERAVTAYRALPAEERIRRRDEGLAPEAPAEGPIYRQTTTRLGPLVGTAFLDVTADVRTLALALRSTLKSVEKIEKSGTLGTWTTDLNRLLREMTDRPRALSDALATASFDPLFFEANNLQRLERWSASHARYSYRRSGNDLIVDDASRGTVTIKAFGTVDLPACEAISGAVYLTDEFLTLLLEAA